LLKKTIASVYLTHDRFPLGWARKTLVNDSKESTDTHSASLLSGLMPFVGQLPFHALHVVFPYMQLVHIRLLFLGTFASDLGMIP